MPISQILSFLVHPSKNEQQQPDIPGARVPLTGKIFAMLENLYQTADTDCDIDIVFRPASTGRQQNPCRHLTMGFLRDQTIPKGRALASRLQSVTTNRSGLGLLFLVTGQDESVHRILISRFPADEGIVAHEHGQGLNIEFLERVFLKSAHSYKSATYKGTSLSAGFWEGRAVDKQINALRELSLYWISDFLDSELKVTPAAGTKRFAVAIKEAIRQADNAAVKNQLIAASHLIPGQEGRRTSPAEISQALGLTDEAQDAVREAMPRPEVFDETFEVDATEFTRHIEYRAVELDNGALLVGNNDRFDEIFHSEQVPEGRQRFVTEGRVINQQLRKIK